MNLKLLENTFLECKKLNMPICVVINIPGQADSEFIINGINSLDTKLNYYKKNYDKNCNHKNASGVKMISAFPIKFYYDENEYKNSER